MPPEKFNDLPVRCGTETPFTVPVHCSRSIAAAGLSDRPGIGV
jgi:hypothetical protein